MGVVEGGQGGHEPPDALQPPGEDLPLEALVPHWSSKELEAPLPQLHPRHSMALRIHLLDVPPAGHQGFGK